MRAINNAEGMSNGTVVTTGNTGSGANNPWDTVQLDGQTIEFSGAQAAHGQLSYHFSIAATAGPYVIWDNVTITADTKTMYARAYVYHASSPATTGRFMQFTNTSVALIGGVGIDSSDNLALKDSTGTTVSTSSTVVPTNAWFRLEMMVFSSATVGQIELKIYLTPDSTTPTETVTSAANLNTRGDDIKLAIFGLPTSVASADFYMDDLAVQDTGYIGPAITTPGVATSAVTSIAAATATANGAVVGDGDSAITERGFCWGTSTNPTTSGSKVTVAGTTGTYSGSLTSLSNNTLYYVRAYAINAAGTAYGDNVTFQHVYVPTPWIKH